VTRITGDDETKRLVTKSAPIHERFFRPFLDRQSSEKPSVESVSAVVKTHPRQPMKTLTKSSIPVNGFSLTVWAESDIAKTKAADNPAAFPAFNM
jgi:hypothetical protein